MTQKILIVGVVLIMCMGLFVGCGNDVKPLSKEKEAQIKQDYLSEFGYEFYYTEFYGEYNGSAVFYTIGVDDVMKTVTLSGVKFSGNSGWTILVWNEGIFYNLEDIDRIFELNILTQRNLNQIGRIHAKYNK